MRQWLQARSGKGDIQCSLVEVLWYYGWLGGAVAARSMRTTKEMSVRSMLKSDNLKARPTNCPFQDRTQRSPWEIRCLVFGE